MVAAHRERTETISDGATSASVLLGLVERSRPAWHAQAACRGMGLADFVPTAASRADPRAVAAAGARARAVCATCPVIEQCRAYAVDDPDLVGTWGGTTERERRRLRKAVERPEPICGTIAGRRAHRRRGEPPCDECRAAHAAAQRRRRARVA